MISLENYLQNPCSSSSIPYWKAKTISVPDNMKIVHDRAFEEGLLLQYNDEKYFRLFHDLKNIEKVYLEEFYIETASLKDILLFQVRGLRRRSQRHGFRFLSR